MTETLSPIAAPHTDAWHALRKTGFGASEAAGACGLSDWTDPFKIYLEKTGEIPPFKGNIRTRMGTVAEPVVREEFETQTGIKVINSPMGLYRSAENPFVLATPDAEVADGDLAEWKTTSRHMAARLGYPGTDEIPAEWICQCQQQMYVLGRQRVHVAVVIDNCEFKLFQVERNDRLIEGIIEAERELWERIQNLDPPKPDWSSSKKREILKEMYGIVEAGDPIKLSDDAAWWWQCRKDIMATIKEKTNQADELKAKVLHEIGNAPGGILPGTGKMVRREEITRAGYTVEEKYIIDVREVKTPKHLI